MHIMKHLNISILILAMVCSALAQQSSGSTASSTVKSSTAKLAHGGIIITGSIPVSIASTSVASNQASQGNQIKQIANAAASSSAASATTSASKANAAAGSSTGSSTSISTTTANPNSTLAPIICTYNRETFPNIDNCKQYYFCWYGQPSIRTCGWPTVYNCFTESCSIRKFAGCCPKDPNAHSGLQQKRCFIPDKKVPNPVNNEEYFMCYKRQIYNMLCPNGTQYLKEVYQCGNSTAYYKKINSS